MKNNNQNNENTKHKLGFRSHVTVQKARLECIAFITPCHIFRVGPWQAAGSAGLALETPRKRRRLFLTPRGQRLWVLFLAECVRGLA